MSAKRSDNEALWEIWAIIGEKDGIPDDNGAIVDKITLLQTEVEGYRLANSKQLELTDGKVIELTEWNRGRLSV